MRDNDNTDTSRDAGADSDHAQDDEKTSLDLLSDANEQFQTDSDLGEMVLQGPIGFHSFYDNEEADEYLTTGDTTLLHRAFDRVIEEIHLDEETVEVSFVDDNGILRSWEISHDDFNEEAYDD